MALISSPSLGMSESNPHVVSVNVERLEARDPGDDNGVYFEGSASIGKDAYEFIINAEIEREHGVTEESEIQMLYGVPISRYWGIYAGIRKDLKPNPSRTWGMLSFTGLAPGFIETDVSFFLGESGRTEFRLETEHDIDLTDNWTLISSVIINVSGQNDEAMDVGSGLSEIETSLLLSYVANPKFSPYVGIQWNKLFGETADYAEGDDEDVGDSALVIGFSAMF